jgi:hypothetical protein
VYQLLRAENDMMPASDGNEFIGFLAEITAGTDVTTG